MSDISKKLDSIEKLAKEAEILAKNLQGNPFSVFDRIAKDITDREDREMALEFTKCICELLKKNGVTPMIDEYRHETVKENSIGFRYGVAITGLDFTEHDKQFERRIKKLESLRCRCHESARDSFDNGNYGILHIVTADELKTSNSSTDSETDRLVKLPFDALETANMLINAKYMRKVKGMDIFLCRDGYMLETDMYCIDDLEHIAEHLLVYCKHHREDEE